MPAALSSLPRAAARRSVPVRAFAVTAPGLAPLAAAELAAIGIRARPVADEAGVAFEGALDDVYAANLWLRTASRVTVRLGEFVAVSFAELEREARRVEWERVTDGRRPLRLRVTCRKSRLYHSDAVAQRVAAAVAHRLGGDGRYTTAGEGADDGADAEAPDGSSADDTQLLVVRLHHDRCTVSADSSGALLHRRGYRQALGKAPLRETLAAALLLAAGYDGTGPLLDPLCGAGTVAIEAALIARRMAPGRRRRFAFEQWPGFARGRWDALLAEADAAARPRAAHAIAGSDRDAGAIAAAVANAERAGVAGDLRLAERALSAALVPGDGALGWIATNPPYGKRLGDRDPLRDLWARLGQFARVRCPGWQLAVFDPGGGLGPALAAELGAPLRGALQSTNGGLPVRVLLGTVPGSAARGAA